MDARSPEESALGIDGALFALLNGIERGAGWSAEVGHRRLFSLGDLATQSARLTAGGRPWAVTVSAVSLSSRLGHEISARADLMLWRLGRAGVGFGAGYHGVTLDGFAPSRTGEVALTMATALSGGYRIGYTAVFSRNNLLPGHGVRVLATLDARPSRFLAVVVTVTVTRQGRVAASAGTRLRLANRLAVGGGYDLGTSTMTAFLSVRLHRVGASAGAAIHPVLGVTKQLWLKWGGP